MLPLYALLIGILALLVGIILQLRRIHMQVDDIVIKVENLSTVEDSAIALLTELNNELKAAIQNGIDPVKLQAISDGLDNNINKLATAITANTPAAAP